MRYLLLGIPCLVLAFASGGCSLAGSARKDVQAKVGDLDFYYAPHCGASLKVRGIPLITNSSLYVVRPGWQPPRFYGSMDNPDLLKTARIESFQGGTRIILDHVMPKEYECPFRGREIFTLLPDNTYIASLEFVFEKDQPALIEWGIGNIHVTPFVGRSYTVKDASGEREGFIPFEARESDIMKSAFAYQFHRVNIDSRMGPVIIESAPEEKILLADYRKNRWADPSRPFFWMGNYDGTITPHEKVSRTVTIRFPQNFDAFAEAGGDLAGSVDTLATPDAWLPRAGQDYITPPPREMEALSGRMPLGPDTVIYLGEQPGAGVENALRFLARDLEFFYNLKLKVVRGTPSADGNAAPAIILGETPRFPLPADFCRKAGLDLPDHDEGYALSADERGVYIAARNERGLFYGVTTLVQLIGATREGLSIRGVQIRDWPALDFRGVHVLAGPSAERDLTPAVRELMARFKINTLVFEADHLFWDGHPELHWKERGMSKAAARKVMDAAAENMIEVIPLIQSLGHMDWLFYDKKYHKLAEDPKQPYAYCPTDPRSYELVYSVYQEAVDFFKPRYFHIGHDEVHTASRFPWRSRNTGKTVGELFLDDVLKHHAWFTERGIRIMLWGDMFLYEGEAPDAYNAVSQEEAVRMRSRLPGDAIITDWHYEPADPEKYRSLAIFKELGLDAIGSGWDHPNNIRQLARAGIQNNSMGYLQTTWAGWDFKVLDNEPAWKQFSAYILAGHYSWSGDPTPPEDLPFNARDKFLEVYFPRKPILAVRPGFLVDLSPLANRTLEDNAVKSGWLGYGSERDFSTFPTGEVVLDGTRFLVKKNDKGQAALLLSGIFNPETASDMEGFPRRADIFLEPVQAAELHLLSCAAFRTAEHVTVAELEVTLEDGSVDKMPLVYARDLFAPDDARVGANAGIVWTGENASGETIRAWDLVWRNPQPELRIRKVSIVSKGTEAPPILFALTGVH